MIDKIKLISLDGLSTFLTKIQAWVDAKIDVVNKRIDKQIFQGTKAELQAAIAAGLVDENTLIILTDEEDQNVYMFCTYEDILNLFPEYKDIA